MSDGSDQPKSSAQSANPFAAPASPAASVNPFGSPSSPAAPAASVNPFAAPAGPAASVNPFAAPAAAPAPVSPASSVNPFASSTAPEANPAASLNPFIAPAEPASASSGDPSSGALSSDAPNQPVESSSDEGPSQDQLQQLNPFRIAAAPEPSAEELQALAGDFKLTLVPKKTVITYAIGAGVAALIIGLLIGSLASGRSEHTKRAIAWKQIDRELKKPLAQLKQLEASVNAIVEGIKKKELKWDQVEAIPTKFGEVKFSLLAPGVSMSQVAMVKLSSLLIKMDDTFKEAASYRRTTLQDKGALTQILDGKDFSARPVHAIHVENYLNNCLSRGRVVCKDFDSLQRGSGRVVALTSAKLKRGKLSVVSRDSTEPFDVSVSELVLVPRPDIVGSGVNAMTVHDQSFGRLQAKLTELLKTHAQFEKILQEKLSLE